MIDDTDRAILDQYLEDSRQSLREIARTLNISPSTVASRVAKMEQEGIIKKYTIQVDHEKLGYDLTVLININVTDSQFFNKKDELAQLGVVNALYAITGEHDLLLISKFHNRKELSDFTQKVLSLPSVTGTKTQLVLSTRFEDFNLLPK